MKIIKQYLQKQGKTSGLIEDSPASDLKLIVVIPAYKEENIESTLTSLLRCDSPPCTVEVLVYVNGKQGDLPPAVKANEECYQTVLAFSRKHSSPRLAFHAFKRLDLSKKMSGVGRARKTLMDEALFRFQVIGFNGIIANLDADCTVSSNYLTAVYDFFIRNNKAQAASIHFEHQMTSEAIIQYELHLRYFIGMQKFYGFPFAFQTVGSSMATRADAYAAVGGMNTKQAGEDFYFLHKFIKNNVCENLTTTTVFPSGRTSDRVPFGTGKAVNDIKRNGQYKTYHPDSFRILNELNQNLERLYEGKSIEWNHVLSAYLKLIGFGAKIKETKKNTTDLKSFKKRFYQFFDAFQLMKALHYLRDHGYPDVELDSAVRGYFELMNEPYPGSYEQALLSLRKKDLSGM